MNAFFGFGESPDLMLRKLIVWMPLFLVSITLHEFAHAAVAYRCGDRTAYQAGRLTLNPLAHLDLFGTLMILFGPIGWAKPVPVDPRQLRGRFAEVWVAAAGPMANLLIAIAAILVAKHVPFPAQFSEMLEPLKILLIMNVGLAIFNLLPIPPLDGGQIVQNLLPYRWRGAYLNILPYGVIILVAILFLGGGILSATIGLAIQGLWSIVP